MVRGIIITYKSKLATFVSVAGSVLLFAGLFSIMALSYVGLIMALIGAGLMVWAYFIAKSVAFKNWIKQLKAKGIIDMLATSEELCINMYRSNPSKRTLSFIRGYNPQAADYISEFIAESKRK